MITYLSKKLARFISDDTDSEEYEILCYGYELYLQDIVFQTATLGIALIFGVFWHVLVSLILYRQLRKYAGGLHAKKRIICFATTIFMLFLPSMVFCKTNLTVPFLGIVLLFILDTALLIRYAPADTHVKPITDPVIRKKAKCISIAILLLASVLSIVAYRYNAAFSSAIAIACTLVCLFTHPALYYLFGCERSQTA